MDVRLENPGGLTGLWAEENTRASLFDAMYRKETFGVSGPRIKVASSAAGTRARTSSTLVTGSSNPTQVVYRWEAIWRRCPQAVGARHELRGLGGEGPDIRQSRPHQVIKGWTQNGQSFEKVFDVVWAGDRKPDKWTVGWRLSAARSISRRRPTPTSVGSRAQGGVDDPDFDASQHAFYYARVLEIPTPRWTLIQSVKSGLPPPDIVPLTGQERAWSSPIWYAPSRGAQERTAGMTVTDLKKKGASALNDAQLKALLVGKAYWVRNNVTGEQFNMNSRPKATRSCFVSARTTTCPARSATWCCDGYESTTRPYKIEGGKLITFVSQDPYSVTIYKLGDAYYAARSNEVGYDNYEIIPPPQIEANPMTAVEPSSRSSWD